MFSYKHIRTSVQIRYLEKRKKKKAGIGPHVSFFFRGGGPLDMLNGTRNPFSLRIGSTLFASRYKKYPPPFPLSVFV